MKLTFLNLLSLVIVASSAFANTSGEDFPFSERPIQFRFHEGFFTQAGDVVEGILKQAKVIESVPGHPTRGILRIPTESGREHTISYRSMKPKFWIDQNHLKTSIDVDIEKSQVYVQPKGKCYVDLRGRLSFQVDARLVSSGAAHISLNKNRYNDKAISYKTKNCGFFMKMGIAALIKSKLEQGIQEGFHSVFNSQEIKHIKSIDIGQKLLERSILVNQPQTEAYYLPEEIAQLPSGLNMEMGFLGYLSNGQVQKMIEINHGRTPYVSELGLNWAFDAGFRAISKNIENPAFQAEFLKDSAPFPQWGQAPYSELQKPLNFDVGIMIKESFLQNMILALYQSGFFNFQVQQSQINDPQWSIHPLLRDDLFQVQFADGMPLSSENYGKSSTYPTLFS